MIPSSIWSLCLLSNTPKPLGYLNMSLSAYSHNQSSLKIMSAPNYSKNQALIIFVLGCGGILTNAISLLLQNTNIFLISQLIGSLSGLQYDRFLVGKYTPMSLLASSITALSCVTQNEWLFYGATALRTINYQCVFYRFCVKNKVFEN